MKIDNVAVISLDDYAEYMELKKEETSSYLNKWYRVNHSCLFYLTHFDTRDKCKGYGFDGGGQWLDNRGTDTYFGDRDNLSKEATPQDIETSLINEAKKRGLVKGSNFTSPWMIGESDNDVDGDYYLKDGALCIGTGSINYTLFKDGHWAEPVEVDKFADLKKAYAEGAEIEYYSAPYGRWMPKCTNIWFKNSKYRIRPLKAGDWIQYGNGVDVFEFIKISHETVHEYKSNVRVKDQDLINKLNSLVKSND